MALKKIKLGDYIVRSTINNKQLNYGSDLIIGVNNEGNITSPKGNVIGVDLEPYKIINNGAFVYNPSRLNIGSIAQYQGDLRIVSHLYTVFYLNEKGEQEIDPNWLFIYFRRKEFQREVDFRNFGSQRPEFGFEKMCDIEILLPDIETQRKYVDVYLSMIENQKAYERGLDDLKLTCDAYIEDLRRKMPCEEIGKYIEPRREKNVDNEIKEVYGVSTRMQFIKASSSVNLDNLSNYKIVEKHDIAYVPTTHMKVYAIAISNKNNPFVVSPIYEVFRVKDRNKLNPEFLFLWLCRDETIRYSFYHSWGSARENFVFDDMCTVKMPIPDINIQNAIVNIYKNYIERKKINERLKNQIKDICPILIKGSIEEGGK